MKEKILIVGGGVAGLMVKNRLEALGYMPILAEKADKLRADGAGLLLGANVTKIFRTIGLEDQLLDLSQPIDEIRSLDHKANSLGRLDLNKIKQERDLDTIVIHRQALHDLLSSTIDQESIWLSHKLTNLTRTDSGYAVEFENGKKETFDRIIAADGLFSKVRELTFGSMPLRHTHQVCWRFIIPTPAQINPRSAVEMWGDQKRVGVFSVANNQTYLFLVKSMSGGEEHLSFDDVLEEFDEFAAEWQIIKPTIDTKSTPLLFGELADASKITLAKDGILFIGDAAHSTTPNMGQGAAMGIESAYLFGELLSSHSFDKAIELYETKRYNKVNTIREKSMFFGKIAHTKSALLRSIRNFILKITPDSVAQKQFEEAIFKE